LIPKVLQLPDLIYGELKWKVCSRLYANAYYAMIVILSKQKLYWQYEKDKVEMSCPDTYDITTFTLIREKR